MGRRRGIVHLKNEIISQLLLDTQGPVVNLTHFVVWSISSDNRSLENAIDDRSATGVDDDVTRVHDGAGHNKACWGAAKLEHRRAPRTYVDGGRVNVRQVAG